MIVVYVQARERQGIDAAIDGVAVDADDARFVSVRHASMQVNLKRAAGLARGVVIHRGGGIVRLQIDESSTEDVSRVIVVLPSRSPWGDREGLQRAILETADAIDAHLEPSDLDSALALAARVVERAEKRKLATVLLSLGLVTLGVGAVVTFRRMSR